MIRVYLSAYLNQNFGDDLFLKVLLERYPNVIFYTMSNYDYDDYNNLKVIKYKKVRILNKMIKIFTFNKLSFENLLCRKCDYIVMLGGSMFIENKSKHYLSLYKNKKYFILGTNFGPYYSEKYKNNCASFFSKAEDVCFRDKYSYNLFNDNKKIRYANDILFSLNVKKYISNSKTVSISVINPDLKLSSMFTNDYILFIKSIIAKFSQNGYKVNILSFCENEGDEIIANKICNEVNNSNIKRISYNGNIDDMLYALGSSEYIVGSRFHANIIGLIMKKKIIPIAYSDKTINTLKDLGFDDKIYDIRSLDEFNYDFSNLKTFKIEKKLNPLDHFKVLDEILKEDNYEK